MAVKTYRLGQGNDATAYALLFETDQTAANRTPDLWTVAKNASGLANEWDTASAVTSGWSTASGVPGATLGFASSSYRSSAKTGLLTGTFAATAWTFTFAVRASTASSQAGRIRMRVFKSALPNPNADVGETTQLTSAVQVGTTSSALSTSADVTSVVTWSPGTTITLTNEYLFFQIGWEITTASGSNSSNVILRTGQAAGGSRFVTPDLAAAAGAAKKPMIVSSRVPVMRAATR